MINPAAHSLNWVDYSIIGVIAFSTIISFFRGFSREAVSLVIWVVGILIALKFAEPASILLKSWIASPSLRYVIAFAALFLIIFIVGIFINAIIHAFVKNTGLGVTDRILGIIFGVARGLFIVAVLLMFVSVGKIKDGTYLAQSRIAPEFKPMVVWLNSFLPLQMKQFSQWVMNENEDSEAN